MRIEIENDYIVGGWEEPTRHYETKVYEFDEEDAVDYIYHRYGNLDDDEIDELLKDFDYEDKVFIEWVINKRDWEEDYD